MLAAHFTGYTMQEIFVDTPEALSDLAEQLAHSEWLALDTEFIRERTYWPKLCLIQVCDGNIAAGIDVLALADLKPLLDVLFDGRILKVFHAAHQDLEIFLHDWGQIPLPLFDTQPAAALLGYGDQIGYARLVKEVVAVDLPKDQSRTDWSLRPLDPAQLRYALDDVIYLGRVYTEMRGQLSDRERLQWLASDFADLADPASYLPDPMRMWKKVKGRQSLRGAQLAVLQQLAAWREERARDLDRPRKWILKDEVLIDLARRSPKDLTALGKIRGMEPGVVRNQGKTLLQLIADGRSTPREDWPSEGRPGKPLTPDQDAMVDLLSAALRLIAEQHQLSPSAIATRKQLEKLVRDEQDIELMHGWRRAVAGEPLLAVMTGQRQIVVKENKPLLTGCE
jgi:ribonuclease D